METADLTKAYEGSYYTICGAGGPLEDWVEGVTGLLTEKGVGTPTGWVQTTGQAINEYAATHGTVTNPFADDLTVIMFPLDGLNVPVLSVFKIMAQDRWFDDIINNMVACDCENCGPVDD